MITEARVGVRVKIDDPGCCFADYENKNKTGTIVEIDPNLDIEGIYLVLIDEEQAAHWRCRRCISEV